jgi:hypothetical protein
MRAFIEWWAGLNPLVRLGMAAVVLVLATAS